MTPGSSVRLHLSEHAPRHTALATNRGVHTGRPTLLLGLEFSVRGQPSEVWGEATPLPGFGASEDHLELARTELGGLEEDLVADWLARPALAGLDAALAGVRHLRSAAARHALEWVMIEALARLTETGPAELVHAWVRRAWGQERKALDSRPTLRAIVPSSAVLDALDPDLGARALRLAEGGILTWKLKCGRDPSAEAHAVEELARLELPVPGPARLRLDLGCGLTLASALDFVRGVREVCRSERLHLEFVEDPTQEPDEWEELLAVAPVAADEVLTRRELPSAGSSAFWLLKPMVHGIGGLLELARAGWQRNQRLVLSHAFDGLLALRASSELACVLQAPECAAGLGPHLGLDAFGQLDLLAGQLLRGERLGPTGALGDVVLLDSGRLGRVLRARPLVPPSERRPATASMPGDDALAASRAAALYGERTFLEFEDRSLSFAALWAQVQTWPSQAEAFVPIVAEPTEARLTALLAALEGHTPALLLHPGATPEAQQAMALRTQRHSGELLAGDAVIVPTSGSTAEPHLVVHTRASLLASASASAVRLGAPTPETRWLLSLPFAHVGGLSILVRCLTAGASVILSPLPRAPEDVERLLRDRRVTHLSVVPTQLRRWLASPTFAFPPNVQCVLVGGGPASASLRALAAQRRSPVVYSYGLTEMASQVATEAPGGSRPSPDGVGTALPMAHLSLSTDGRIRVGGPMLMRTYLGEAAALDDGLFTTSDAGLLSPESVLTVLGRLDDLIITGGENVAPSAVESVLAEVPGVLDVCVVGRSSDEWGQTVVAVVVPRATEVDWAALEAELQAAARAHLPSFARPKAYRRSQGLPLLHSGKVDRRRLSAALEANLRLE